MVCRPQDRAVGQLCKANADCESGVCIDCLCIAQPRGAGGVCDKGDDDDCQSGYVTLRFFEVLRLLWNQIALTFDTYLFVLHDCPQCNIIRLFCYGKENPKCRVRAGTGGECGKNDDCKGTRAVCVEGLCKASKVSVFAQSMLIWRLWYLACTVIHSLTRDALFAVPSSV